MAARRLVPICPELTAGFGVPRPPAEIVDGDSGQRVLAGAARVVEVTGADLTAPFIAGAQAAMTLAREHDCGFARLADGSPPRGSSFIYDGSFAGNRHAGAGVTAALLRQHGIEVFADTEIDALRKRLAQQGGSGAPTPSSGVLPMRKNYFKSMIYITRKLQNQGCTRSIKSNPTHPSCNLAAQFGSPERLCILAAECSRPPTENGEEQCDRVSRPAGIWPIYRYRCQAVAPKIQISFVVDTWSGATMK